MSDRSFVCATCGETHPGLPADYGFRLPDEVHALEYLERYLRCRSNADLCTLDERRYFVRGVLPVPFAGSDTDEFRWGVWVELGKAGHDAYVAGFDEDLSGHPRLPGRIANEMPGYGATVGLDVEVQFQAEGTRPFLYFPSHASHALAHEQRGGITRKRHHDILEATGFFDDKEDA